MMLSTLAWWTSGFLIWVFAMIVARRMQTGGRHYEYQASHWNHHQPYFRATKTLCSMGDQNFGTCDHTLAVVPRYQEEE